MKSARFFESVFRPQVFDELRQETVEVDAYVYELPLVTRFRGITNRSGVLLRGAAGWAEVSPFWDYDDAYSARWLFGALDHAVRGLPAPERMQIPVNVTVPAVGPQEAYRFAQGLGATTAKVKVADQGHSADDDLARLRAVREALGPKSKIRIDVNGRWDLDQAIELIPRYDEAACGLEYVEQPVMDVDDLATVRRKVEVPIAADESIRRAEDPFLVKEKEAADVVVLKNQPLGGVRAALELIHELEMPVVVSSALESSVGLRAGLGLAGALCELNHACGLGTASLLKFDVTSEPLKARNGAIKIREVEPDLERIHACTSKETTEKWRGRIKKMWQIVVDDGFIARDSVIRWPDL
ncbi:o-succinylbenzoate synthase [Arcanobacterium ihumii]|uniref:o-succinylbenzoate synthase n=1 Tax=Arcanobacterium ihumii TaxID=2138162 RepID=UPI000F53377B|nr:o-succinylbenzoate synthase [Arcanobacterium ihumii]